MLRLCPGCSRHVRAESTSCPFCAAALPQVTIESPPQHATRLSRSALVLSATLGAAACNPVSAPAYGAPAPTAAPTPAAPESAPTGEVTAPAPTEASPPIAPAYGGPPAPPGPTASEPLPAPTGSQSTPRGNPGVPIPAYGMPPVKKSPSL